MAFTVNSSEAIPAAESPRTQDNIGEGLRIEQRLEGHRQQYCQGQRFEDRQTETRGQLLVLPRRNTVRAFSESLWKLVRGRFSLRMSLFSSCAG